MKILILGNSSIFQRKIYKSLIKFKKLSIEVASKRKLKLNTKIKIYNTYKDAIDQTEAKIVYISLINSEHFKWALYSLKNLKHVLIDKPFTINLKQTKTLIKFANKKKLLLSEAVVFHKHQQFQKLFSMVNLKKKTNIIASFHIPKLNKNNFRNYKKYGGGCFLDMSPYAAYLIHLFLRNNKYAINKLYRNKNVKDLNEFFSIIVNSSKVKIFASFKFNSEYKNQIIVQNNSKKYYIDYAFSPPINKPVSMKIFDELKKKEYKLYFKKQNTFDVYFSELFVLLKKKKYNFFYNEIEKISKIRKKIC